MSGGGGSSTTVQKADPWSGQQPYLKQGFQDAQSIYEQGGFAPNYYPGQTVAPLSDYTTQAINLQAQRALNGSPAIQSSEDQLARTMNGDYLNANPVNGYLGSMASGQTPSQGLQAYQDLAGGQAYAGLQQGLAQPTQGMTTLQYMTQGGSNPYLDNMYGEAAGQVASRMNANFESAGRYGSGAHQAATADALGNLATQMYGQAYDSDANRRLSAAQSLAGDEQAQNSLRLQAQQAATAADQARAQGLASTEAQRAANQIQAAGAIGDSYSQERKNQLSGMMFAPQLANADYQDLAALSEAGTALESHQQDLLNADIQRWNYDQSQPEANLEGYLNAIQGNYGGTTNTDQQTKRSNPLGSILLPATYGVLGGMTGGLGGAAAGGILGLLGEL